MELLTNKKYFAKFLLCLTLFSTLQPVLAAPTPAVAKKASKRDLLAKKLNLSSNDLSTVMAFNIFILSFSAFFFAFGPQLDDGHTFKKILFITTIIPPLIAMALPPKAVDIIAKVPVLRQFFRFIKGLEETDSPYRCKNKKCEGFCNECKVAPLYLALLFVEITLFIRYTYLRSNRLAQERKERDARLVENQRREDERLARQCQVCHFRERNQQTPCCNRNVCQNCFQGYCVFCHVGTAEYQERQERLNREAREREQARREQVERQEREWQERLDRQAHAAWKEYWENMPWFKQQRERAERQ